MLGAAAVVLVLVLLLAGGGEGDNKRPIAGTPGNETGQTPGVADSGSGRLSGTLSAGGLHLLGARSDIFAATVGLPATGRGVRVLEAERRGFFVGEVATERVFVVWDEGDGPRPGSRVDLVGRVRRAPADARQVLALDADDARTVQRQGAFVRASIVSGAVGRSS
ncbi:MAG TPA: hypothetical protein VD931_05555 [Baekduia sp.]|nr:hypothetical protein [Baekduia sp.]